MFNIFATEKKINNQFFEIDKSCQNAVKGFISAHDSFIQKAVEKVVDRATSDLLVIARNAFGESVEEFTKLKGNYFSCFADLKIRTAVASKVFADKKETIRATEVHHFQEQLKEFGIKMVDLTKRVPKPEEKQKIFDICIEICENEELLEWFLTKRKVPVKKAKETLGVSSFLCKRYKKYITALILIKTFEYRYLKIL